MSFLNTTKTFQRIIHRRGSTSAAPPLTKAPLYSVCRVKTSHFFLEISFRNLIESTINFRRGMIEIFRNCRVSGSERIKKCPWASQPRTGSHKSAVYSGYHGLHGECWHLCHQIRQVVGHSSQCVTRCWTSKSIQNEHTQKVTWMKSNLEKLCAVTRAKIGNPSTVWYDVVGCKRHGCS